ncbi:hypothetical protein GCM10020218_030840 [Dactylosporangium vinaceum]
MVGAGLTSRLASGPMRDIVATIQPEQDALVRAELDESICLQGAPGKGFPDPGNRHTSRSRIEQLVGA